jgi:hypothetical protein
MFNSNIERLQHKDLVLNPDEEVKITKKNGKENRNT